MLEFVIRNLVNPAIRRALGLVALSGYRISNAIGLILLNMRGFTKNRLPRHPLLFLARHFGVFLFSACGELLSRHCI